MKFAALFEKISRVSLYLLVVLIPLWFLPITQNSVEYQKQALLVLIIFVGITAWLAKMVYEGRFEFRANWLHLPVVVLLGAFGVSTLLSSWRYGSLWGWPLHIGDNFLTFFCFGLLYFFISQSARDARHLFSLLVGFIVSGTLAVTFALLQMKEVFLLPFDFAQTKNFNTLGSSSDVGIFAALLLPLAFMLASRAQKAWKVALLGATVLLFAAIALIDFSTVWFVIIAGSIVLAVFDLWPGSSPQGHSPRGRISLPMVFVLIALFFLIVKGFSIPGAPVLQAEASPSFRGEFGVLKDMISENPFSLLVGSGPGTFVFDYAKFRSPDLNQTIFWDTRFRSGSSEFLDWLVTKGIEGLLALLALIGVALAFAVKRILEEGGGEDDGARFMLVGLVASVTAGIVGLALHPANFSFWFLLWVVLGSLGFLTAHRTSTISLTAKPSFLALGSSIALLTVAVIGAGLLIMGGQKYYAEMGYLKGVGFFREGNVVAAIDTVAKSANLNSAMDLYWRDLAQLFLTRANQIAADQSLSQDVRAQQTGIAVNNAVASAKRAVEANPANVANWNVQGFVYRSFISVPGADAFAIQSYEKAIELEPASPFPWTELARVKILRAQVLASQEGSSATGSEREALFASALANLEKAISLKGDYAPAHYLMAVAQDQQGNQAAAIQKLEETKLVAPNDVGLAFQLGVAYYRLEEFGKARDEFERAKSLALGNSNVRYMLGLVYDRLGRKADAAVEFGVVLASNPQNQEVKDILNNLREGRSALYGISPNQPPIEEAPSEIEK